MESSFLEFLPPPTQEFILLTIYLGMIIAAISVRRRIRPLVSTDKSYLVAPRRSNVQVTLLWFALNWSLRTVCGIPTSSVILCNTHAARFVFSDDYSRSSQVTEMINMLGWTLWSIADYSIKCACFTKPTKVLLASLNQWRSHLQKELHVFLSAYHLSNFTR